MNILITGGAGFIGSHLAQRLLDKGHSVHIIDDLSTGSVSNVDSIRDNPNFSFSWESIFNETLLREEIDRADIIYHLAAAVGVQLIVDKPVHTIVTNVGGTELVLRFAKLKNKRTFIASTSEVYGKNPKLPFNEESDLLLGPTSRHRWAYACSKAIDEFNALAHYRETKLPVTVIRFFNTVGPRQTGRYGMVIPRFVDAALNNKPIPVFGDGKQSRCFTDVADVVNALVDLNDYPQSVGQVYNIGNPEEISMENLAKKIVTMTDSKSELEYIPYEEALGEGFEDMMRRVPCIDKIKKLTGYQPKYSLDMILERVIDFIRNNNS